MDIESKLRPLYLLKILKEQTDENHKLSTVQLCHILKDEYGIDTFRTTIKTDIEALQQAGYLIQVTRSSQNLYNYQERDFSLQEIKTLLDALHSSQMINGDYREQLINKIYKLAGPFKANELKRNWIDAQSNFTISSQITQTVDIINEAINKRRKIKFRSFCYNIKKIAVPDRDMHIFNPLFLLKKKGHICVAGFLSNSQEVYIQRIDRIYGIPEITEEVVMTPANAVPNTCLDIPFYYFGTDIKEVELQVDNTLMDEILDRFGLAATTYACDQNSFRVLSTVGINQAFYSWLFSFQGRIRLKGPESIVQDYASKIRLVNENL